MLCGYARVSTDDQSLAIQLDALKAAGAERIYAEQVSGTSTNGRDELAKCLADLRAGDVLIVTRLDRLARSMADLSQIVAGLVARNIGFKCLQQSAVDTTNPTGRLMLNILGAFAEFETELRKERVMEGIKRAQKAGKYLGRTGRGHMDEARRLREEGLSAIQIANRLKITVRSVYRATRGLWLEEAA